MNANLRTNHPGTVSPASIIRFRGDVARQAGNVGHSFEQIRRRASHEALSIQGEQTAAYRRAAQFQQLLITWALVADDNHAQIYEYRQIVQKNPRGCADKKLGYELVPVLNEIISAGSIDNLQMEYGRHAAASDICWPYGDQKEELLRRFTKIIADNLHQAAAKNSFDRLVLAAPAKMIGELWKQSDGDLRDRIY